MEGGLWVQLALVHVVSLQCTAPFRWHYCVLQERSNTFQGGDTSAWVLGSTFASISQLRAPCWRAVASELPCSVCVGCFGFMLASCCCKSQRLGLSQTCCALGAARKKKKKEIPRENVLKIEAFVHRGTLAAANQQACEDGSRLAFEG